MLDRQGSLGWGQRAFSDLDGKGFEMSAWCRAFARSWASCVHAALFLLLGTVATPPVAIACCRIEPSRYAVFDGFAQGAAAFKILRARARVEFAAAHATVPIRIVSNRGYTRRSRIARICC